MFERATVGLGLELLKPLAMPRAAHFEIREQGLGWTT